MNQKVVDKWSADFGMWYHRFEALVCGHFVTGNCDIADRRSGTEKNGTSRHHSCAAVPISQFGNVVFAVCDKLRFVNGKILGCNPCNSIVKFNDFCRPVFEMQEKLEQENRKLAAMRDSLLPRLMSGEIDVAGIDI